MRRLATGLVCVAAIAALVVLSHLAIIEIGREVVTLRTRLATGAWQETRLWAVDHDGAVWLHSAGDDWRKRFEGDPIVQLGRGDETRSYRARLDPGPHPEIDRLLREKYGVADRWVRFVAPCDETVLPVRLELVRDAD